MHLSNAFPCSSIASNKIIAQALPADLCMHAFPNTFYLPSLMSFSVFGAYLIRKSTTTPAKKPVIAAILVSRHPPQDAIRLTNGE
jgi:hypothetical protein